MIIEMSVILCDGSKVTKQFYLRLQFYLYSILPGERSSLPGFVNLALSTVLCRLQTSWSHYGTAEGRGSWRELPNDGAGVNVPAENTHRPF